MILIHYIDVIILSLLLYVSYESTQLYKFQYIKTVYEVYLDMLHHRVLFLLDRESSYLFSLNLQAQHNRIASIPPHKNVINCGICSISIDNSYNISSYLYSIPSIMYTPSQYPDEDISNSPFTLQAYQLRGYEHNIGIDFVLTFALRTELPHSSFIETLYKANIIEKPQVIFEKFDNNNKEGYLILGDYDYERLSKDKYNYIAKCKTNLNEWGCEVNAINYINNDGDVIRLLNTNDKNYYLKLQSNEHFMLIPKKYYEHIINVLFKKYLNEGICVVVEKKGVNCDCELVKDFPKVLLSMGGYTFKLGYDELFKYYEKKCYFIIRYNTKYNDEWILGNGLWLKMSTQLDYVNKEITFYSKDIEITEGVINGVLNTTNINNNIIICIFNILICGCGIVIYLYITLKKHSQ